MCNICNKIITDIIICCDNVNEIPYSKNIEILSMRNNKLIKNIPYLPNLKFLDCSNTNITELLVFNELISLSCSNTNIMKIPYMQNLKSLICNNTLITKIHNANIMFIQAENCKWLHISSEKYIKIKRIQLLIKKYIKKRNYIINKSLKSHKYLSYILDII
jgi:hypothetical protein